MTPAPGINWAKFNGGVKCVSLLTMAFAKRPGLVPARAGVWWGKTAPPVPMIPTTPAGGLAGGSAKETGMRRTGRRPGGGGFPAWDRQRLGDVR